jgi:hypothetical protein
MAFDTNGQESPRKPNWDEKNRQPVGVGIVQRILAHG